MAQMIPPVMPQIQQQQAQQPLAAGPDPRSQYLAAAIQAMQNHPQGSPTGLGENLLSQMMLQKAYQQHQAQNQSPLIGMGQAAAPPQDPTLGGMGGGQPGMMGPAQGPSGGMANGAPIGSGWGSQLGKMMGFGLPDN